MNIDFDDIEDWIVRRRSGNRAAIGTKFARADGHAAF